ncbi:complement C1q-like protein 3 [Saccostrea cucullata]|uniref:complement C1q-like protein 3 n=1 Tax=Saccostrea cuccullata TaxID=36930 RepID=UPI002ED6657A
MKMSIAYSMILSIMLTTRQVEPSSPLDFIKNVDSYASVCHKIGFKRLKGCSENDDNVIAFHAALKYNLQDVPVNTTIKFEDVLLNKGKAYDPKTGIFTSPVDGIYFFEWTFMSKRRATLSLQAVVDGLGKASTCVNDQGSYHVSTSGHLLFELKKGSKAWIRTFTTKADFLYANTYTFFTGHKIN